MQHHSDSATAEVVADLSLRELCAFVLVVLQGQEGDSISLSSLSSQSGSSIPLIQQLFKVLQSFSIIQSVPQNEIHKKQPTLVSSSTTTTTTTSSTTSDGKRETSGQVFVWKGAHKAFEELHQVALLEPCAESESLESLARKIVGLAVCDPRVNKFQLSAFSNPSCTAWPRLWERLSLSESAQTTENNQSAQTTEGNSTNPLGLGEKRSRERDEIVATNQIPEKKKRRREIKGNQNVDARKGTGAKKWKRTKTNTLLRKNWTTKELVQALGANSGQVGQVQDALDILCELGLVKRSDKRIYEEQTLVYCWNFGITKAGRAFRKKEVQKAASSEQVVKQLSRASSLPTPEEMIAFQARCFKSFIRRYATLYNSLTNSGGDSPPAPALNHSVSLRTLSSFKTLESLRSLNSLNFSDFDEVGSDTITPPGSLVLTPSSPTCLGHISHNNSFLSIGSFRLTPDST